MVNPFPHKLFLSICSTSVLKKMWEKWKLLITSNFSFSHNVFYPFGRLSAIFIKFKVVVCKFFQFRGVQNLSFEKGLRVKCKKDGKFSFFQILMAMHWEKLGSLKTLITESVSSACIIKDMGLFNDIRGCSFSEEMSIMREFQTTTNPYLSKRTQHENEIKILID